MNNMIGPAFIVFEFNSIAKGYSATALALAENKIRLLEASPVNPGHFLMIAHGSAENCREKFNTLKDNFKKETIESFFKESVSKEVLAALYGQSKVSPKEALLFVETKSIASAFAGAEEIVTKYNLKLIEFKAARAIGGKALLIFTGDQKSCSLALQKSKEIFDHKGALVAADLVSDPSTEFLSLFQIE